MTLLDGYAALVTGAGTQLGAETALALSRAGACVVVADRRHPDSVAGRIADAGGSAHALAYRPGNEESTRALLDDAAGLLGGVDLVVTGPAPTTRAAGDADGIPGQAWHDTFAENLRGTWLVLAAARPHLARSPRGNAVVLTGDAGWRGGPGGLPEISAAAGLLGLVRAVAREVGDEGTRVNLIGFDEEAPGAAEQRCLKRPRTPADVSAAVTLLAAPQSGFITGQTVLVNGGSLFN